MENLTIGLVLWFFGVVFTTIAIIILLHSRKKKPAFKGDKQYEITPHFKERDFNDKEEQYFHTEGGWQKCNESLINTLWKQWVEHPKAIKYVDDEGFTVFGFKEDSINAKDKTEIENVWRISKVIFAWFIIVSTLVLGYISEYVALFRSEVFIGFDFAAFLFAMWILIKTKK